MADKTPANNLKEFYESMNFSASDPANNSLSSFFSDRQAQRDSLMTPSEFYKNNVPPEVAQDYKINFDCNFDDIFFNTSNVFDNHSEDIHEMFDGGPSVHDMFRDLFGCEVGERVYQELMSKPIEQPQPAQIGVRDPIMSSTYDHARSSAFGTPVETVEVVTTVTTSNDPIQQMFDDEMPLKVYPAPAEPVNVTPDPSFALEFKHGVPTMVPNGPQPQQPESSQVQPPSAPQKQPPKLLQFIQFPDGLKEVEITPSRKIIYRTEPIDLSKFNKIRKIPANAQVAKENSPEAPIQASVGPPIPTLKRGSLAEIKFEPNKIHKKATRMIKHSPKLIVEAKMRHNVHHGDYKIAKKEEQEQKRIIKMARKMKVDQDESEIISTAAIKVEKPDSKAVAFIKSEPTEQDDAIPMNTRPLPNLNPLTIRRSATSKKKSKDNFVCPHCYKGYVYLGSFSNHMEMCEKIQKMIALAASQPKTLGRGRQLGSSKTVKQSAALKRAATMRATSSIQSKSQPFLKTYAAPSADLTSTQSTPVLPKASADLAPSTSGYNFRATTTVQRSTACRRNLFKK